MHIAMLMVVSIENFTNHLVLGLLQCSQTNRPSFFSAQIVQKIDISREKKMNEIAPITQWTKSKVFAKIVCDFSLLILILMLCCFLCSPCIWNIQSTIDRLVNKPTGELKIDRKMEIIFFVVESIGLKLLSSHIRYMLKYFERRNFHVMRPTINIKLIKHTLLAVRLWCDRNRTSVTISIMFLALATFRRRDDEHL